MFICFIEVVLIFFQVFGLKFFDGFMCACFGGWHVLEYFDARVSIFSVTYPYCFALNGQRHYNAVYFFKIY